MPRLIKGKSNTWTQCVKSYGNELDKLALRLLECHEKNHLACVALCRLSEKKFLIATNGFTPDIKLSKGCVEEIMGIDDAEVVYLSQSRLSDMHAEMKLLSVLKNDFEFDDEDFPGLTIGVSKPCCILCATVLDAFGVTFSMYHKEETDWLSPYPANNAVGCKRCQKDAQNYLHVVLHYPKDFANGVDLEKILAF